MYHNVRDASGRFTKKSTKTAKKKVVKATKVAKTKEILNVFVLDDSASMWGKRQVTIDGFNEVLVASELSAKTDKVNSTDILCTFGERGHFKVVGAVKKLTNATYNPSQGGTALWDAIIRGIDFTESLVKTKPAGTKVIFTIFTDGQNNLLYDLQSKAKELIDAKNAEGWVINFMGAGNDILVKTVANSVGIYAANTMSYSNDKVGTASAFDTLSKAKSLYSSKVSRGIDSNVGFFAN